MSKNSWLKNTSANLIKILLIVAFWEAAIMFALSKLDLPSTFIAAVVDTITLATFSGVSIIFLIIRPEQQQHQKEMIESINFLGQELRAVGEIGIISAADLDGKIIYANDNFCKISGYAREELIGKDHRIINSGLHSKELFNKMWVNLKAGKAWQGKLRNVEKNGEFYWIHTYITPIYNNDGEIYKYLSFGFDITKDKAIEESFEQEKIKSVHLGRLSAIGEMAAGVAHEINNPLTVINGLLSLIDRKLKGQNLEQEIPKLQEIILKAQGQVFRTAKIVQGLREFSRSSDNLPFEMVSSKKILNAVGDLCSEKMYRQGVHLEIHDNGTDFQCNPIQIEQVLVNLINNSVDAIANLEERWVKIESISDGNFLEISVTDSGAGISKEAALNIMQPFFTTKEIGKGTGLGLSISFGIIKQHGGILYFDSLSKNTRFVIQVPLEEKSLINLIDFDDEIKKHEEWRIKIMNYLAKPNGRWEYEKVETSNYVNMEKWIERIEPRFKNNSHFIELKDSYVEFNKYLSEVVQTGSEKREHILKPGSEYDNRSKRFIAALQEFYTI